MSKYEIVPAFAVPICITRIDRKFLDPLKKYRGLYQEDAQDVATDEDYQILDKVPETKKEILKIFTQYINGEILYQPDQRYVMTTSWLTENRNGRAMDRHMHKNSFYSCVTYFDKVDQNHAPLIIENPIHKTDIFVAPNAPNIFTIEDYIVPMHEGLMVIFPSNLNHYHAPFTPTGIPRKSLACNFMPIGKYGGFDSTIDSRKLYG